MAKKCDYCDEHDKRVTMLEGHNEIIEEHEAIYENVAKMVETCAKCNISHVDGRVEEMSAMLTSMSKTLNDVIWIAHVKDWAIKGGVVVLIAGLVTLGGFIYKINDDSTSIKEIQSDQKAMRQALTDITVQLARYNEREELTHKTVRNERPAE